MMPTSVHGIYKKSHGFTVIEILLVMLVIGISLAMVLPNLSKNHDQILFEEGNRLAALLYYAKDISGSTGQAIAWDQTPAGYRFLERDQDHNIWKPLLDDPSMRERVLPDDVQIEYVTEQSKRNGHFTKVIMNPSGVQAPFEIGLHNKNQHIKIVGNLIGQITISRIEN
jgi:general secretion pathway protein H